MAATSAQRQAAYRQRAKHKEVKRLNLWIDMSAAGALARLARREGVSQRAMIERLVNQADDAVYASLDLDSPEWREYEGVTA